MNINYLCRLICNAGNSCPIEIIPNSDVPPRKIGNSFYWTTPGGRPIYHPNAYNWPKVYHNSTLRIQVGGNWRPKIPKNMELQTKNGTFLIRKTDKMDFHFNPKELLRKDFCSWARKEMAKNYQKRLETKRNEKLFRSKTRNTFVSFNDARNAGNCVQGIFNWAKKKLNINKERLLEAPWLVQFPAKTLLKLDGQNQLVKNSINQAYLRETLICI